MAIIIYLLTFIIFALTLLYRLMYDYNYWKRKGVTYIKPLPVVGNLLRVFLVRSSVGDLLEKFYQATESPYFGIYVLNTPILIVKSPELIKSILVKDFDNFCDRNLLCDERCDSMLSKMLAVIKNPEWKPLRTKISPIYTTAKLKSLTRLIETAAEALTDCIDRHKEDGFIESKELCAKYTTDVISSCAFGIEAGCFTSKDTVFRQYCRKIFAFNFKIAFSQACYFMAPSVVKLFKLPFVDPEVVDFFRTVFWKTVRDREASKIIRNDLINVIIQIKNDQTDIDDIDFDGDKVVAQALQFFAAGLETTSTIISLVLYELCRHPDIQIKARKEIQIMLANNVGLTYETIQDMKYLHMVVCETLRKYPVVAFIDRVCDKNYTIPGSDVLIEKGTPVFIPLNGLHHDPQNFPDPEEFDPERFSDANRKLITNFSYLPFGEGSRGCIGERFGLLTIKLALARIISEYEVVPCEETPVSLKFDPKCFLLTVLGGLPIKFIKL